MGWRAFFRGRSARHLAGFLLLSSCLLWTLPLLAVDIPRDSRGLPQWEVRDFDDFPIRIQLQGRGELEALLAGVPLASFDREQIRPTGPEKGAGLVFEPRVTAAEAAALSAAGFEFERLPDLEKRMRQEMERTWAAQAAAGGDLLKFGERDEYHTYSQVGSNLVRTAEDHPDIAEFFIWGSSVQGRDLYGIKISDNISTEEAEAEVRISSSMHGDEPPGMEMLLYLVDYLTDNYNQPGYEDVTNLVDNYEIHILPLHNPDGYVAHNRENANGRDLNRNFPVPNGHIGDDGTWVEEIETVVFKNYGFANNFVISQNIHSGALVVNYPWDYTYDLNPDDDALVELSLEYSTYNEPMYNGPFDQGIVRGALWYVTRGNLQDWSYHETGCIDVTLEISQTKWPSANSLLGLWDDNRESYMHWIKAARYGVNGVVTAAGSGDPLLATVTVLGNAKSVFTDPSHGDYYKLLDTGTYDIRFEADGYVTQTIQNVQTTWGTPTVLDVVMQPEAQGLLSGHVRNQMGEGLPADIEVRTDPGDEYVTTVQSDPGDDGYYSLSLLYGDYRLQVSSPGYISDEGTVSAGPAPVALDFTLISSEEVVLFGDGFENGTAGWDGGWGLADPAEGHSSANSLTDSPGAGVDYPNYADTACALAEGVDLSSALSGTLSFWAKWEIENSWDCCRLQISTDGGESWTSLATAYTEPASGQGVQVPVGDPVFDGDQPTWVENVVDLGTWLGETDVRFRFHLESDSGGWRDGFYFDDFEVRVLRPAVPVAEDLPAPVTSLTAARPNPFNPQTNLFFEVARSGPVRLRIFDVQGRLIRTLVDGFLTAGRYEQPWNGRTDDGGLAASGVYFGRLTAGTDSQSLKMMLVK